jgi:hypothetical protein
LEQDGKARLGIAGAHWGAQSGGAVLTTVSLGWEGSDLIAEL